MLVNQEETSIHLAKKFGVPESLIRNQQEREQMMQMMQQMAQQQGMQQLAPQG